ncbi:MAG: hypothetical protein RH982_17175 [Parvibaculum sp.]
MTAIFPIPLARAPEDAPCVLFQAHHGNEALRNLFEGGRGVPGAISPGCRRHIRFGAKAGAEGHGHSGENAGGRPIRRRSVMRLCCAAHFGKSGMEKAKKCALCQYVGLNPVLLRRRHFFLDLCAAQCHLVHRGIG